MESPTKQHQHKKIDLDEILPTVGEFGRYQKLILWLVCLPACFPCGFCAFNQLFMADVPEHWCRVTELSQFDVEERRNISIPSVNNTFQSCRRYALNWTKLLEDHEGSLEGISLNTSWPTEGCKEGWEYNRSVVYSSIVIDFDLVCDKDIYPTLGLVALNIGGPIGVYFFGRLSDTMGRKKAFFLCLTTMLLGSLMTCTAHTFWWWAFSRIIVGLTVPAIYQIPFIISLELVGPNYRAFVTVLTCIFYTFGLMMLSGITYLVRDWVYLGYATSLPFALYYLYWLYLPESPRWLITKGRFEEALEILEDLARTNRKMLPLSFRDEVEKRISYKLNTISEPEKGDPGCWVLFKTPNMRLKTLLITFNWFANDMVYIGLSYYAPSLGSNHYLSFLLSSAAEIPGYFACWFIMDRWGRRWPLCVCMMISGVCCMATVLISSDDLNTIIILYLISKSTISASFLIIYPFAGELYPTQVRGLGIGLSAYIAGLGLIITPFITYLGSETLVLPLVIMGVISVIGGISGLRLPETLHYPLPETLEEGEQFGKDFSLVDYFRCCPIKPISTSPVITSYENLEMLASSPEKSSDGGLEQKFSIKKLAKRPSIKVKSKSISSEDALQVTYWF